MPSRLVPLCAVQTEEEHSALSLLTCHSAMRFIGSSGPLAALLLQQEQQEEGGVEGGVRREQKITMLVSKFN